MVSGRSFQFTAEVLDIFASPCSSLEASTIILATSSIWYLGRQPNTRTARITSKTAKLGGANPYRSCFESPILQLIPDCR